MVNQCIYIIKSKLYTDRCYIGSARDYKNRQRLHLLNLIKGNHHSPIIQNHVNKYGINDIYFEVIEEVNDISKLIEREQFHIDLIKPYFNILKIAGSPLGKKRTEEAKLKMRLAKLGKKKTEEDKQKISLALMGHKINSSDEAKEKLRIRMKGNQYAKKSKNDK